MDKNLLIQSIIEYREIGKELMNQLGKKFRLDISNEEDYSKLVWKANEEIPRNGELSKKWNYAFHGMECGFHNRETKQSVEVKLINPPDFGVVESWFLLSFLKTTNAYKHLAEDLDWQKLEKILNKLYEDKDVEEIKE